jgi:DNA polymerase-3 subunit beta
MPDGNYIDFQSVPDSLSMKITAGQIECSLSVSYCHDEFPISPKTGECLKRVTINAKELQPFLFFASKDELKGAMQGLRFNMQSGEIAGTDAHRLFVLKAPEMQTGADFGFTVYAKDLKLIAGYGNCPAEIYENHIVFKPTPFLSYTCRLIDSRYPDYNAVIPRDNPHTATYNVQELITGIKQVLPACNINTFQVNFSMHSGQIEGMDADFENEAKTVVNCISKSGEPETFGFNPKFLMEILNCIKTFGNVTIRYSTPNRAVLIESEMRKDLTVLLMPCLIK